jgi:phenylpyruvate tautomerase PptA (4-oxalocrotonate tautomerase family)
MPIINIQWINVCSKKKKALIAKGIDDLLVKNKCCNLGETYIVFNDVAKHNFAEAGYLCTDWVLGKKLKR